MHSASDLEPKDPPMDLVNLLKWTMKNVQDWFRGISGRRWIPRPQALQLVQQCHDIVETYLNMHVDLVLHCQCCTIAEQIELAVRKAFLASLIGHPAVVGICLPRPRSCTCNRRLGFMVASLCVDICIFS